jgi:hypothetical protein
MASITDLKVMKMKIIKKNRFLFPAGSRHQTVYFSHLPGTHEGVSRHHVNLDGG